MWITGDVELPEQILQAHEGDNLVFFVGAGASVDAPSNLPLFGGLAENLAHRASEPFPQEEQLDFFLGRLQKLPQGFDVHHHTYEILSDPGSKFNSLHTAIIDLAGTGESFRVVTTNYDNHLASAADSRSITVPNTWHAPALPLGREFSGIVHLHGSVLRPHEQMVLTDSDFGHAYITDGWAARFLLPMFSQYTVVFIGYSYNDPIMRYLSLGLPVGNEEAGPGRFAFTDDPSNSKWSHLGINPIGYPVVEGSHAALGQALMAWAKRSSMGQTDHRTRMHAIVTGGTSLLPHDRDYFHARLRRKAGAEDFAGATGALSNKSKLEWLNYLEEHTEFKKSFTNLEGSDANEALEKWFTRTFIESLDLNGAALCTVQRFGQTMNSTLYQAAELSAHELWKLDKTAGNRWKTILATSIYGKSAPPKIDLGMQTLTDPISPSMTVLRVLLRPFLQLERNWVLEESPDPAKPPFAKVAWRTSELELTRMIELAVEDADHGQHFLRDLLSDTIVAAYELIDSYYGERVPDPLSEHRSAIEPHTQDDFREPIDAIIDGVRELGINSLPDWPDLPNQWWSLDRALMQRLALYLVTNGSDDGPDDKLDWLLRRIGLYSHKLKHETYKLLESAVTGASETVKQRILRAVEEGPEYQNEFACRDRQFAYAQYNLLGWLKRCNPTWEEVNIAFGKIQEKNRLFTIRGVGVV